MAALKPAVDEATRFCRDCQTRKPMEQFYPKRVNGKLYHAWECIPCHKAKSKRYNAENGHKVRAQRLKKFYNISVEEYEALLAKADGCCDICGGPPTKQGFHLDHNERTGKVRGLLCLNCNIGLGQFQDCPTTLRAAIKYLRDHDG